MTDTQKYISNLNMPEKILLFKELYNELAGYGIEGDTELAHVNTFEASLLKSLGGSGTINEITGLREYKGGGSPPPPPANQTVTQTSEFPTELKPFISDILGEAKGEFGREKAEGYIPFQGPQLAAFTPEQQAAFATGRQQFGAQGLAGTPLGAAGTYYAPALAATALGTAEIGAGDIGRRMDPFLQNVVDIAKREARRDEDIAQQGRAAQAVGAGSFGGSRQAIVEAEANRNLQRQLSDIQAAGLSTAFQNAQRAAEAQRARELAGGRQFAGLGESAFQRARGDITGLAGVGEAQQARSQQALDIARREFEEEKAFPQTALQRYGSIIRGFPLTPSQQTVVSQREPIAPSLAQTLLGGVGTGVGLYGAFGGFKKAGGLVGLLGGGTPTNPLRPPYNLFSGPSSRVGVPQYQGGGPLGVNLGGGYASGAGGGANTPAFTPSSTAPTANDLNSIIDELRRRKLIGRSAGGLAGLTVSRHQSGEQPRTGVQRLGDFIGSEIFTLNPETKLSDTFLGREVFTTDPQTTLSDINIPDFIRDEILTLNPNTKLSDLEGPVKDFITSELLTTDPETKFEFSLPSISNLQETMARLQGAGASPYSGTGIPTKDVHQAKYTTANVPIEGTDVELPFGTRADPEQIDLIKRQEAIRRAGDAIAESETFVEPTTDAAATPSPERPFDPLVDPDARSYTGLLPDVPATTDYKALESAQQEYLDALKNKGYDKDKYLALANFGLNLMSESPQYEGEGFLSVASRAGKEPLAQFTEITRAERDAGLGFLKAKMDIEGVRASIKSGGEQKRFDNLIAKALTGAKLTTAEAAWLKIKYGNFKAISLTSGDLNVGKVRLGAITDALEASPERLGQLTEVMNEAGWKLEDGKPLSQSNVEQILAEITQGGKDTENSEAYINILTRSKEIYEGSDGRISQADSDRQAVKEFLLGGGELDEPSFWSTIGWGTSTAGAARANP